jgi:hypothetical protein
VWAFTCLHRVPATFAAVRQPNITPLLAASSDGDGAALQQFDAWPCPEIRRVARQRLAQSARVPGLDTTARVHEGFLRLAERVLRPVVTDPLRAGGRNKRGGDQRFVTLSAAEQRPAGRTSPVDLIALARAPQQLLLGEAPAATPGDAAA